MEATQCISPILYKRDNSHTVGVGAALFAIIGAAAFLFGGLLLIAAVVLIFNDSISGFFMVGFLGLAFIGIWKFISKSIISDNNKINSKMLVPLEKIAKQSAQLKASGFKVDYEIVGVPGVALDRSARKVAFVFPDRYDIYDFSDIRSYRLYEHTHSYKGHISNNGDISLGGVYGVATNYIQFKINDIDGSEIGVAVLKPTGNTVEFDIPQAKKLVTDTLPFIFS